MAINFALGLLLVRVLLTMGEGVYAVILLLGTSVGISGMLKEVIRAAMVAEVGLALHSGDNEEFKKTYATAFFLSLLAAAAAVGILGVFYFFLDRFNIPPELIEAAGIFLIWRAAYTFIAIAAAPTMNLLPITGRMSQMNFWLTLERAVEVAAAYVIALWFADLPAATQLIYFSVSSTIGMILVNLAWIISPILVDRNFIPDMAKFDRTVLKKIRGTVGWNGFVVAAMNLYGPLMIVVINLAFGVGATVMFGLANQLLSYIRQSVMGIVVGLDAVFTKLTKSDPHFINTLISNVTRLQTSIVLGLCGWCAINIELILRIWVGTRLDNPTEQIPTTALFFKILLLGIGARSITEGWMKYLSGIGHVAAYGPLLLAGAALNPLFIVLAIYFLPENQAIIATLISFSALLTIVHLVLLPRVMARYVFGSVLSMLVPMVLPFILCNVAIVVSYLYIELINPDAFKQVIVTAMIFAATFGVPFLRWLSRMNEKHIGHNHNPSGD